MGGSRRCHRPCPPPLGDGFWGRASLARRLPPLESRRPGVRCVMCTDARFVKARVRRLTCERRKKNVFRESRRDAGGAPRVAHLRALVHGAGRTSRAGAAVLLGHAAERLLDVQASASLMGNEDEGRGMSHAVTNKRRRDEKRGQVQMRAGQDGGVGRGDGGSRSPRWACRTCRTRSCSTYSVSGSCEVSV